MRSLVVPNSKLRLAVELKTITPVIKVAVPPTPGLSVPPLEMVEVPLVALELAPSSVAPVATVSAAVPVAEPVLFVIRRLPALTVVAPEYVLAAERVRVPVPDFVRVPVPEITPPTVVLPAPLKVRPKPPFTLDPVRLSELPAVTEPTVPAAVQVIAPAKLLSSLIFLMAPVAPTPVPFALTASAVE